MTKLSGSDERPGGDGRAVLALVPSAGLGGGIETYSRAVLGVLGCRGVDVRVVALLEPPRTSPTLAVKSRFLLQVIRQARWLRRRDDTSILVFHPALAIVAGAAWLVAGPSRTSMKVFFHGTDAWALRGLTRSWLRRRKPDIIAVSSFTAGSLVDVGNARRLAPGIDPKWYQTLLESAAGRVESTGPLHVLSVFRLADAERKGARALLEAGERVRRDSGEIVLTFAGRGPAVEWLRRETTRQGSWVRVVESPSSERLAELYGSAGLFVLPSFTDVADGAGEGFGIVLVEAQLAGVPVIGPAFGGSGDAMLAGVTGMTLADESIDALTKLLQWCVAHRHELESMSRNAREWARVAFSPERYAQTVLSVIFGEGHVAPMGATVSSDVDAGQSGADHGGTQGKQSWRWMPDPDGTEPLHSGGVRDEPGLSEVCRTWSQLGDTDPLFAILSAPGKERNRWELDAFFATGVEEVKEVMAQVRATGRVLRRERALDFGCGVGRVSQAMADYFEQVDGVDIAESMISRAQEMNRHGSRCTYHLNTRPDLELFRDATFDLAYSTLTLQHMPHACIQAYIAELLRVTKPDGMLVFQLPSLKLPMPVALRAKMTLSSFPPVARIQQARHGLPRARATMNTIERSHVVALLDDLDAELVGIHRDGGAGEWYESYRYFVTHRIHGDAMGDEPER